MRVRIATYLLIYSLSLSSMGCERDYREETDLIEEAETHYTAGDYDAAQQLYRRFLEVHPRSPYSDIAAQRLRIIERELDGLMGQPGMPTPQHVEQRVRFQRRGDDGQRTDEAREERPRERDE